MKNKMIYVMNVDWNWIKQRPHFFAEQFSNTYDITVFYQYLYNRKNLQTRENNKLKIKPLYLIPRIDRYASLKKINFFLKNLFIKRKIKKDKPEIVYFTFPDQYYSIPKKYTGIVVYDCMDNHSAFIKNQYAKKELENQELSILIRANIIIVSSCKLKKVLCERYGDEFSEKIEVIRNGYDGQIIKEENKDIPVKNDFTITYFGTISSWFNFKYLEDSLNEIKGIRYKLIGPVSDVVIPDIEGIDYIGTIEHDKLYEEIKNDDCLFMPFKVNEIIESVDPVKLYEYINMGKNIISVSYPEILRFEPFVYFYSDYNSYIEQIYKLMNNNRMKYSQSERLIFLKNNSWSNRVESINKLFLDYERSLEVDHERKEN